MELKKQNAIGFDLVDDKPVIKIFDEYSNLTIFELRRTQLISLLYEITKILWNHYELERR